MSRHVSRRKTKDNKPASQAQRLVEKAREANHVTIFCHPNADPDSVCSAVALRELLLSFIPDLDGEIRCPNGIGSQTKELLKNLEIDLPREDDRVDEKMGLCIIVDTNNLAQLGPGLTSFILESNAPVVIIDHHHKHPDMEGIASLEIIDETSTSTAEIVSQLYEDAGQKPSVKIAKALLAAIFAETRSFQLATKSTFENTARLITSGVEPRTVTGLLNRPLSRAERIARLKAASRSKYEQVAGWLLVMAEVGSYQSSAARSLLSIGGDLAIVAGKVKETVRVSLRATDSFHKETGIHLARDLAIPVGPTLGGSGGGHPTAAGMNVNAGVDETLQKLLARLRGILPDPAVQS